MARYQVAGDVPARVALLHSLSEGAAAVFATVLTQPPITRVDIARQTGLSQAAVTRAVTPLVAAGLVADNISTLTDGLPGRPATLIGIIPDALVTIGIKVNADELIGVATDLTTTVLAVHRVPLQQHDFEATVEALVAIHEDLRDQLGPRAQRLAGVGVSVSGDIDPTTGVVRASAHMGWRDAPLGKLLTARLGVPVVVENDVRALTIGEHWFGRGLGSRSFAVLTIGRGIGSGLYVNGDVLEGANGVAGEIGHLPLTSRRNICNCGRRGCVEAVASMPAIAAKVSVAHGRVVGVEEVVRLARAGDPAATKAFHKAAKVIGTAAACLVTLAGPELIIIGGEAVSDFDLFAEAFHAAFQEHAFEGAANCRIVVKPHTFEDWARGAAATSIRTLVS